MSTDTQVNTISGTLASDPARWSEYKPSSDDFMWQKMPHGQLAKCAEALALRKAFPRQRV